MAVALFHRAFGDPSKPFVFSGFEHPRRRNKRPVWQVAVEVGAPTVENAFAARDRLNSEGR